MWIEKQEITDRERRWFGLLFGLFSGGIVAILVRWHAPARLVQVVVCATLAVVVVYYAVPRWQLTIWRGWLRSVTPLGWCLGNVLLFGIYWVLFVPLGVLLRVVRYDPLQRSWDAHAPSYFQPWSRNGKVAGDQTESTESYFRPF